MTRSTEQASKTSMKSETKWKEEVWMEIGCKAACRCGLNQLIQGPLEANRICWYQLIWANLQRLTELDFATYVTLWYTQYVYL